MGPYYITVFVFLLGPIKKVVRYGENYKKRKITLREKFGEKVDVEVFIHITALLNFYNDAICTMIMSFDTLAHNLPQLEIYGGSGTLSLPDPNCFSGENDKYYSKYSKSWEVFPSYYDVFDNFRGISIAEMAEGILKNKRFRANGDIALHVVDVMEKVLKSIENNQPFNTETYCESPELMSESEYPTILPE